MTTLIQALNRFLDVSHMQEGPGLGLDQIWMHFGQDKHRVAIRGLKVLIGTVGVPISTSSIVYMP